MRIAHMASGFPVLTQTFILNQVRGLIDQDHDVTVVARRQPDSEVTHDLIDDYNLIDRTVYSPKATTYPAALCQLVASTFSLAGSEPRCFANLLTQLSIDKSIAHRLSNVRSTLKQGQFDIYHAHFGKVANGFRDLTACRSTPFIVSFYGIDARKDPSRYDDLFKRADAITVLSEDMRSSLINAGCPRLKTHLQPLSIDTDRFTYRPRQLPEDRPIQLLTVARLVEKKGIEYAIRAVGGLETDHEIRYVIAGDGERRSRLEALVERLELTNTVEMVGWQQQSAIQDLMEKSHLFVLPSVTAESGDKEGTPTVLLEAQSSGLPVVSTRHAGIPEIVADGESGLLVPERDVDALQSALETLLSSPNRWAPMGHAGSERIERKHSIKAVSSNLVQLYHSLQ